MKLSHAIILIALLTGQSASLAYASTSVNSICQFDKSTMIKEKLKKAQECINNGNYSGAKNYLNGVLKLDPNNAKAKELLEECESGIKKQKQRVHQAYLDACKTGTISALQNFISKYPNSEYVSSAKSRIEDYSLWQKAKEQNTITAYNYYLSQSSILAYKNDAEDAITTIQSEIEWNNCKTSNDEDKINSFIKTYPSSNYVNQAKYRLNILKGEKNGHLNSYQRSSKSSSATDVNKQSSSTYSNEAEEKKKMMELQSKEEWKEICQSPSKSKIKEFMRKYPSSSLYKEAVRRLSEMEGIDYYNSGLLRQAYSSFNAAGGRQALAYENRIRYDVCEEFVEYKSLSSYSFENNLLTFLNKYPNSRYKDQVSNYLAIRKARNLSGYSTHDNYMSALSYAKDSETREMVKQFYNDVKHAARNLRRQKRRRKAEENGGMVQLGFEIMDMGYLDRFHYNVGLSIKFGHYESPVQLEFGFKPGIVVYSYTDYQISPYTPSYTSYYTSSYSYYYSYETEETGHYFHMPLYSRLKINLGGVGQSKFYVAGLASYNLIKDEDFEKDFSAGIGIGFAKKRWDYCLLYYKQDVGEGYSENRCIGTSFGVYF